MLPARSGMPDDRPAVSVRIHGQKHAAKEGKWAKGALMGTACCVQVQPEGDETSVLRLSFQDRCLGGLRVANSSLETVRRQISEAMQLHDQRGL